MIDQVKELEEMGVVSLKIEGRMKSAAYVYESVMQTKSVLDNKFRSKQDIEDLMVTFNRGYTKGHAYKMSGYDLMNPQSCNHQGINIGKVRWLERSKTYWIFCEICRNCNETL